MHLLVAFAVESAHPCEPLLQWSYNEYSSTVVARDSRQFQSSHLNPMPKKCQGNSGLQLLSKELDSGD